jgi:hypothetical protein
LVDFTVVYDQSESQASGDVVATDLEGQSCSMGVDFTDDIGPGQLIEEIICEDEGIQLFATNEQYPGGIIECSFTDLNELDPPLPPAYFPVEDCKVVTVDSAISGETIITLKVEGTFDPDLRLLSSRFDGLEFGPWRDDTELVQEIIAIPDPTRLRGKSQWSIVKVSCAKLDIDCSDPSLNGLDQDGDGYVLCNGTTPVDCNDQRDVINPAAQELCSNGLDDDCDGLVDDDDDDCVPLSVNLDSFTAELEAGGVRLRWTTSMELDNLGFRVLRAAAGEKRAVLTPQLIPAAGTEGGGASYEYLDSGAPRRGVVTYYLEDVDLQGRVTLHGPLRVRLGGLKPRAVAGR